MDSVFLCQAVGSTIGLNPRSESTAIWNEDHAVRAMDLKRRPPDFGWTASSRDGGLWSLFPDQPVIESLVHVVDMHCGLHRPIRGAYGVLRLRSEKCKSR